MLTVSPEASVEIANIMKDREPTPIRLFVHSSCGGPGLALALDEMKDKDTSFEVEGQTFIVETALLEEASPLEVTFGETGFVISSSLVFEEGSGCCSGCSGCG